MLVEATTVDRPPIRSSIALLGILCVVALAYVPSLEGPFLWDDRPLILDAPQVVHLAPLGEYFSQAFWTDAGNGATARAYYRPCVTWSYAVQYHLHGANAVGFHAVNLALHLLNVSLVFRLLGRRVARSTQVTLAGAWGLLPRLAESVAWISGRTDVMATTFSLATLLFFPASAGERCPPRSRWTALQAKMSSITCFAIALFSKEVSVAMLVPLACLAYSSDEERGERIRSTLRRVGWYGLPLMVYGVLRFQALSHIAPEAPLTTFSHRALVIGEAIARYAWMIAWPFAPRAQIGFVLFPNILLAALGALLFVLLVRWATRAFPSKSTDTRALLGFAAAALLPVLHLVPLPVAVVCADRYLYLPTAALALAAAPWVQRNVLRDRSIAKNRLALGCVLLATAALGTRTFLRSRDFSDEPRFWIAALKDTVRDNTSPREEMANLFYRAGLFQEAREGYEKVLQIQMERPSGDAFVVRSNLANALSQLGLYEEALSIRRELLRARPELATAHLQLALNELHLLDFAAAQGELEMAERLLPGLAQGTEVRRRLPELARTAAGYLAFDTHSATTLALAGYARFSTDVGRGVQAERAFLLLLERSDLDLSMLRDCASFLVTRGSIEDGARAVAAWQQADPSSAEAFDLQSLLAERTRVVRLLIPARRLLTEDGT